MASDIPERGARPGVRTIAPDDVRDQVQRGLGYGSGVVGKGLFRVRDTHVANHLLALIEARSPAAAKLDLLLRGIALLPSDIGKRSTPGIVLPKIRWEQLHDLVRGTAALGAGPVEADSSAAVRKSKRKWVDENLSKLEEMGLVKRRYEGRDGKRPLLYVLKDDGSGDPFDDPDGVGETYTTIHGGLFPSGASASWSGRMLSAYLAAMYAEHHNPPQQQRKPPGTASWFRSPEWFADPTGFYGPPARVRLPVPKSSLVAGLTALEKADHISRDRILFNPYTQQRLQGPRNYYRNFFLDMNKAGKPIPRQLYRERVARELAASEEDDL